MVGTRSTSGMTPAISTAQTTVPVTSRSTNMLIAPQNSIFLVPPTVQASTSGVETTEALHTYASAEELISAPNIGATSEQTTAAMHAHSMVSTSTTNAVGAVVAYDIGDESSLVVPTNTQATQAVSLPSTTRSIGPNTGAVHAHVTDPSPYQIGELNAYIPSVQKSTEETGCGTGEDNDVRQKRLEKAMQQQQYARNVLIARKKVLDQLGMSEAPTPESLVKLKVDALADIVESMMKSNDFEQKHGERACYMAVSPKSSKIIAKYIINQIADETTARLKEMNLDAMGAPLLSASAAEPKSTDVTVRSQAGGAHADVSASLQPSSEQTQGPSVFMKLKASASVKAGKKKEGDAKRKIDAETSTAVEGSESENGSDDEESFDREEKLAKSSQVKRLKSDNIMQRVAAHVATTNACGKDTQIRAFIDDLFEQYDKTPAEIQKIVKILVEKGYKSPAALKFLKKKSDADLSDWGLDEMEISALK